VTSFYLLITFIEIGIATSQKEITVLNNFTFLVSITKMDNFMKLKNNVLICNYFLLYIRTYVLYNELRGGNYGRIYAKKFITGS